MTYLRYVHLKTSRFESMQGSGGVRVRRAGSLSAWAAARRAWGAGASAACRCGCTWRGSTGTASAAPCASGSGASGWTPPCRTTCSATAPRSPPPPRTCCGTSTAARAAAARALQPTRHPRHDSATTTRAFATQIQRCKAHGDRTRSLIMGMMMPTGRAGLMYATHCKWVRGVWRAQLKLHGL